MLDPPVAMPISTGEPSPRPSFSPLHWKPHPSGTFYPDVRDRAACARFRLRRKARAVPQRNATSPTALVDVYKHLDYLYELVQCLQKADSECLQLIRTMTRDVRSALTSALPLSLPTPSPPLSPTAADSTTPITPSSLSLPASSLDVPQHSLDAAPHSPAASASLPSSDAVPRSSDTLFPSSSILPPPSLRVVPPSAHAIPSNDPRPLSSKAPRGSSSLPGLRGAFNRSRRSPTPKSSRVVALPSSVHVSTCAEGSSDDPHLMDTLDQSLRGLKGRFTKRNLDIGS